MVATVTTDKISTAGRALAQENRAMQAMRGPASGSAIASGTRAGSVAIAEHNTKNAPEDGLINIAEKVRGAGFSVWTIGWFHVGKLPIPLPFAPLAAWAAGKLAVGASKMGFTGVAKSFASASTAVNMVLKPIHHTLHKVTVGELHKAPGSLLRGMAAVARGTDGKNIQQPIFREPGRMARIKGFFSKSKFDIGSISSDLKGVVGHFDSEKAHSIFDAAKTHPLSTKVAALEDASKKLTKHIGTLTANRNAHVLTAVHTDVKEAASLLKQVNAELAVAKKTAAAIAAKNTSWFNGLATQGVKGQRTTPGRLNSMANTVDATMEGAAKAVSGKIAPVAERVSSAVGGSAVGKWANNKTQSLFNYRHTGALAKVEAHVGEAVASFNQKPRGLWQRMTFRKPVSTDMPEGFAEALKSAKSALYQKSDVAIPELKKAAAAVAEHAKTAAPEVQQHAAGIIGNIEKAIASANKATHIGQVAEGGAGAWLKNMAKSAGKVKMVTAIIGTAVAAGTAIAFLTAKKETRAQHEALNELKADIGNGNSGLAQSVEKSVAHGTIGRVAGATVNAASEAMMLQGAMSMNAVGAQMGLDMLAGQFGGPNQVLAAHQALKAAENGSAPLEPQQKVEAVKILVAEVPAVAKQGGKYNRLTGPVAAAIVEQNLSVKQTMQLLDNPAEFNAFATAVKAKMDAAAAQKAAPVAVAAAEAPKAAAVAEKPAAGAHNAASPTIAAGAQHQGMVAEAQRAVQA